MNTNSHTGDNVEYYNVKNLRLDPKNPRLAETLQNASQSDLLLAFYNSYELDPLFQSLSQHGYFNEEPLIGVRKTKLDATTPILTIVEGNRRLAALQILLFSWAQEVTNASNLPAIKSSVKRLLNPVPVKLYDSREDVVPYLGVRHIRGVKDWDPLAKARYVRWLKDQGYTIQDIVRNISSRRDVVQRWLLTLYTLEQANTISDSQWDDDPNKFKFSWLYTALGYARIRAYLGIRGENQTDPQPDPIMPEKRAHLMSHMCDLYGPPPGISQEARVKDSREIRRLAAVYESQDSLDALRGGATLNEAYARSIGEAEELRDYLRQVNQALEHALGMAHRHANNDQILKLTERAKGNLDSLLRNLGE